MTSRQTLTMLALGGVWASIFAMALITKSRAAFAGVPIIAFAFLVYLGWVTYNAFKSDKAKNTNTNKENTNE